MKFSLGVLLISAILVGASSPAPAASPKALDLRQANGLTAFTPPAAFLSGNFVADESNPGFIFGPVEAFAKSRPCSTTWLIEASAPKPAQGQEAAAKPAEYTIYLEEDCPERVTYYVFLDQSSLTPQQWFEWRKKFHMSKAELQYGSAQTKLEQACQEGCGFTAELRFIQQNGELSTVKSPETVLMEELKVSPLYDLNLQKKLGN